MLPRMRPLLTPPLHTPSLLLSLLLLTSGLGCGKSKVSEVRLPEPAPPTAADTDSAVVRPIDAARLRALVSDGRASLTLVNVWATWCGPCREEFPAMLAVARRHGAEGVRLVLVSADYPDQLPATLAFLQASGARDTSYIKDEQDMAFINGVHPKWSGALPATLLYDAHGRLLEFWEGGADSLRFERAVTNALHPKGNPS
jgi:thiol-disulfide isomerase/thioredoxin